MTLLTVLANAATFTIGYQSYNIYKTARDNPDFAPRKHPGRLLRYAGVLIFTSVVAIPILPMAWWMDKFDEQAENVTHSDYVRKPFLDENRD